MATFRPPRDAKQETLDAYRRLRLIAQQMKTILAEVEKAADAAEKAMAVFRRTLERSVESHEMACAAMPFEEWLSSLPTRARKAIMRCGVHDAKTLSQLTVWNLMNVTNCGKGTIQKIHDSLEPYGVWLREDSE